MTVDRLSAIVASVTSPAIAVSGGVDSMTLAFVTNNIADCHGATVFHAVSPAVPPVATQRVKSYARRYSWRLRIVDAGEFSDPRYRENPLNRCYYCKSNLYARIRQLTGKTIFSGANINDLDDYRPGLGAAREAGVQHPFIEAGMNKRAIRKIAREHGLEDVAELPAQPCLSSRVETGITINVTDLAAVDDIERLVEQALGPGDIRCRITPTGVRLELPDQHLKLIESDENDGLVNEILHRCRAAGLEYRGVARYRRGSAFIRESL